MSLLFSMALSPVLENVVLQVTYSLFRVWVRTPVIHFLCVLFHIFLSCSSNAHVVCGPKGVWNRHKSSQIMKGATPFNKKELSASLRDRALRKLEQDDQTNIGVRDNTIMFIGYVEAQERVTHSH